MGIDLINFHGNINGMFYGKRRKIVLDNLVKSLRVRNEELQLLNRQLDRLNYTTVGDLVKDLIAGKITRLADDQQIEIMKTNLQTNSQARYYVLYDPEKLTDKYISAWMNFGISVRDISA